MITAILLALLTFIVVNLFLPAGTALILAIIVGILVYLPNRNGA